MKDIIDFELHNGVRIPSIGFGTWQIAGGEIALHAINTALLNGYRHIDTARNYGNEASVGKAVKECGIDRAEIFITTKLPAEIKTYSGTLESFEQSLNSLGLDYIDLYLIHAPWPWSRQGYDYSYENLEVWKAMEEIYKSGRCRALGVSNFEITDLKPIMKSCTIKPMVNQINYFVGRTQKELVTFCKQNNILVEGYSPLATGALIHNKAISALAAKYNATLPQLCIRFMLQNGVVPLPKSTNPEHIKQNLLVDFEISDKDMKYLDGLTYTIKGMRLKNIKRKIKKLLIALKVSLQKMKIMQRSF